MRGVFENRSVAALFVIVVALLGCKRVQGWVEDKVENLRGGAAPSARASVDPPSGLVVLPQIDRRSLGFEILYSEKQGVFAVSEQADILLWDGKTGAFRGRLQGHPKAIKTLAFEPEAGTLLSVDASGELRRWDVRAGTSEVLASSLGTVYRVVTSPRGKHFAISSRSGVRLFAGGGRASRALVGPAFDLGFSPDGNTLLKRKDELEAWDVMTAKQRWTVPGKQGVRHGFAVSPDSEKIVFSPDGERVVIAKIADGKEERTLAKVEDSWAFAWSSDGKRIAAGTASGVLVFDAKSGDEVGRLERVSKETFSFDPTGKRLALSGGDQLVLADAVRAKEKKTFMPDRGLGSFAWTEDGARLLVLPGAGKRGAPTLYQTESGKALSSYGSRVSLERFAWSPDGQRLVVSDDDQTMFVVNALEAKVEATFEPPGNTSLHSVAWSPKGDRIAMSGQHELLLFDTQGKLVNELLRDDGNSYSSVWLATFSPDGSLLVAGKGEEYMLHLYDGTSGAPKGKIKSPVGSASMLAFSADSKRMVVGGREQFAVVELPAGGVKKTFSAPRTVGAAWLSSDQLVTGHEDGKLRLWRLSGSVAKKEVSTRGDRLYAIALSHDARWLAAVDMSGPVQVFDVASMREVASVPADSDEARSLAWHPCQAVLTVSRVSLRFFSPEDGGSATLHLIDGSGGTPSALMHRSTGHYGGQAEGLSHLLFRAERSLTGVELSPASAHPDLMRPEVGKPWFSGCSTK